MVDQLTDKLAQKALSRRGFLASAGAVTAATMVGCGNNTTFTPIQVTTPTPAVTVADSDVLNFALNLEYLEAQFYLLASTGTGLSTADSLGGFSTAYKPGGVAVPFVTPLFKQIAAELAQTELQHVRALQAAIKSIGGTPISAPPLDLVNSFNAVAVAAGMKSFDPFASELAFIVGALVFEDVGVTAYTGAANLFSATAATNGILSAAAGIQAAEAYHAGSLRTLLAGNASATGVYSALNAFNAIVGVRATLGGGNETTVATGTTTSVPPTFTGPSTIVAADSTNSLGYARTTDQVLHIVYGTGGGAGVSAGGFFPNGLNGLVKTTAA